MAPEIVRKLVDGKWRTVEQNASPNGGSQAVTSAYHRLTPTEIKSAPFTPFEIVAAPGGTKFLLPLGGFFRYIGGTTHYSNSNSDQDNTALELYYGNPATLLDPVFTSALSNVNFWSLTTPTSQPLQAYDLTNRPNVESIDLPLSLAIDTQSGSPFTAGDIPIDVWVWYVTADSTP